MPGVLIPDTELMARTAEMLDLPRLVCRRRSCRRAGRCGWHFPKSGEPCCLADLTPALRRLFNEVCARAEVARDLAGEGGCILLASPFLRERMIEDAAVEIARPLLPRWRRKVFRAMLAARAKKPPASLDMESIFPHPPKPDDWVPTRRLAARRQS
jgi:hypothetical protein